MRSSRPRNGTTRESVFIVQLSRPWENLPVVPRAPKMRSRRAVMKFGGARRVYDDWASLTDTVLRRSSPPDARPVLEQTAKPYEAIRRLEQQCLGFEVILIQDKRALRVRPCLGILIGDREVVSPDRSSPPAVTGKGHLQRSRSWIQMEALKGDQRIRIAIDSSPAFWPRGTPRRT